MSFPAQISRGQTFIQRVTASRKSLFRRSSSAVEIRRAFLLREIAYSKIPLNAFKTQQRLERSFTWIRDKQNLWSMLG